MKKAELYRSIEGIKPDRSMKNRIMTAVEANDRITVQKRPVFLPIAAAVLLIVNVGLVGNFFMGNNFISRWTNNESLVYGSSSASEFSDYVEKVYKEINEHDYTGVEILQRNNYNPQEDKPWFELYSVDVLDKGTSEAVDVNSDSVFVRYIQKVDGIYTNHEYIVGYDGNGKEIENIISVTESNVDHSYEIAEKYKNEISETSVDLSDAIDKAVTEYTVKNYDDSVNVNESQYQDKYDMRIFFFPYDSDAGGIIYRFPVVFSVTSPVEYNVDTIEENVYFLLDENGKSKNQVIYDNYWKETVSRNDVIYKTGVLPNVVNADADNAVKYLEKMGFSNISKKYVLDSKVHNTVVGYNYGMAAGDVVNTEDLIELLICGKQMPDVSNMELSVAADILKSEDVEFELVYMNGAKAQDANQYVFKTEPSAYEIVENAKSVKVYVESESSSMASAFLGTEMELDYSYSENGIDYYVSEVDYPDVIFEGTYNGNGKVVVSGISTKNDYYEMCPSIFVGMSLEEIDNLIIDELYYQDKDASGISLIEYDSEIGYNYKFVYTDNNASYTVLLKTVNEGSFEEQVVSVIYVKREPVSTEDTESEVAFNN